MAKLFPFRPAEGPDVEREPRLVNIDDEAADDVFAALSSDTARAILQHLYEEPTTASEVAEAVDTSLQNARYHLEKLETAGLVEDVDTWYSSRGTEMTVYGPTSEPLVVAAGEEESRSVLRNAIKRVVGAVGILGVASVMIDRLSAGGFGPGGGGGSGEPTDVSRDGGAPLADGGAPLADGGNVSTSPAPAAEATPDDAERANLGEAPGTTDSPTAHVEPTGGPAGTPSPDPSQTSIETTTETGRYLSETATSTAADVTDGVAATATQVADTSLLDLGGASPGLAFFAGGILVVGLAAGWWYLSRYRPLYRV